MARKCRAPTMRLVQATRENCCFCGEHLGLLMLPTMVFIFLVVDQFLVKLVDDPIDEGQQCRSFELLMDGYNGCIREKMRATNDPIWSNVSSISNDCGAPLILRLLKPAFLTNHDDVKTVFWPGDEKPTTTVLTLGVGADVGAEMRLKRKLKNTKFYGVDPMWEAGKIYRTLGRFIQAGVGLESGSVVNASVMNSAGQYEWQEIRTRTLDEILSEVDQKRIDYLWMDIEGAEYKVLPQMLLEENGVELKRRRRKERKSTICQINVEIHGPPKEYRVSAREVRRLFASMVSDRSSFAPVWLPAPTFHHHVALVNFREPICVRRFFPNYCFQL